jgi:hypothetical protein
MTVPLHMKCRACGFEMSIPEGIGESDLVCPACRSALPIQSMDANYHAPSTSRDDFRRDHLRTSCVLVLLAILGFAGVFLVGRYYWQSNLALIALGIVISLSFLPQYAWARTTRSVILVIFAIGGVCLLIALAVFVFLFVKCLIR